MLNSAQTTIHLMADGHSPEDLGFCRRTVSLARRWAMWHSHLRWRQGAVGRC